jgi:arginine utilization protein RocB
MSQRTQQEPEHGEWYDLVNIGPFGHGAHQRDGRVLMSYPFGMVPQLIVEVIACMADLLPAEG